MPFVTLATSGKNAILTAAAQAAKIRDSLQTLTGADRLPASAIAGMPSEIWAVRFPSSSQTLPGSGPTAHTFIDYSIPGGTLQNGDRLVFILSAGARTVNPGNVQAAWFAGFGSEAALVGDTGQVRILDSAFRTQTGTYRREVFAVGTQLLWNLGGTNGDNNTQSEAARLYTPDPNFSAAIPFRVVLNGTNAVSTWWINYASLQVFRTPLA